MTAIKRMVDSQICIKGWTSQEIEYAPFSQIRSCERDYRYMLTVVRTPLLTRRSTRPRL